jgi:hypothetical protein
MTAIDRERALDQLTKHKLAVEYCGELARRPYRWGELDCALSLAEWLKRLRGIDPAARWRGTYRSPAEALALVKARGGFVRFLAELAQGAGLAETSAIESGDLGVVELGAHRRLVMHLPGAGAIRIGDRWMVKTQCGVMVERFDHLKAWRA